MRTWIAEPERPGVNRWHGDDAARRAVYNNRNRIKSGIGKAAMRERGEMVERSFENVSKRYLIHVAGFNLGILMRHLTGKGTPRGWSDRRHLFIFVLVTPFGPLLGIGLATDTEIISIMLIFASRMGD